MSNFFKKDNKELEEKFNANFLNKDSKEKEIKEKKQESEKKEEKSEEKSEEKELDFNELMEERRKVIKKVEKSLKKLNFTKDEINETLYVVAETYKQIQALKDSLIGTNINNNPYFIQKETIEKIASLTEKMSKDLDSKVKEIIIRKKL